MVGRERSHARAHRRQGGVLGVDPVLLVASGVMCAVVIGALVTLHLGTPPTVADDASTDTSIAQQPTARVSTAPPAQPVDPRWLAVLTARDATRSRAWRLGRPELLAGVYVPGSGALQADRANLQRYLRRGLLVRGVRMQFSSVVVQHRAAGSVTLLVVDRLGPATVVTRAGDEEPLPRDRATRHRIGLRLTSGRWRISSIALASSRSAG